MREPLSESQSVACAEVQAGAFKVLAGSASTTKTGPTVGLFGPCFKTGRTRPEKTRACEMVHQAKLGMAASGAHARQASVNEPSGARLFSGFWVES